MATTWEGHGKDSTFCLMRGRGIDGERWLENPTPSPNSGVLGTAQLGPRTSEHGQPAESKCARVEEGGAVLKTDWVPTPPPTSPNTQTVLSVMTLQLS